MKYSFLLIVLTLFCSIAPQCSSRAGKIDRKSLVNRHIVHIDTIDILNPLTVGNGRFAFTADITGLQTFPELYEKGIPLGTQSEWGWHSFPDTEGFKFGESLQDYDYYGRKVPFSVQIRTPGRNSDAVNYLRQNPHRLHLGMIGLDIINPDGSPVKADEISYTDQVLDPWTGELHSKFRIGNVPVEVTTFCHQGMDLIAARIKSPLINRGLLRVRISFPYPTGQHTDSGCDWTKPDKHRSELTPGRTSASIRRIIDGTSYFMKLGWKGKANISENEPHIYYLQPAKGASQISFSCLFTPDNKSGDIPDFNSTAFNNKSSWQQFWMSGGAVDLSGSTDPRAPELERRIVLSQYLTRIQCAGVYPPSETGLTFNSWYGKFHLEMHYWHGIHFALWNRTDLLERSLGYYNNIKEKARETAGRQGFEGLRWPKMTDPSGKDSPSSVGSFLIWQQPHIIYMAELCYRNNNDIRLLEKYSDIVFGAADFMASFAWYDSLNDRYVLGPPMIPAQERFPAETTMNSPFELAYWQWGLKTACEWRKRLRLGPRPEWEAVIEKLSPLPQKDGLYLSAESAPDSYTNPRFLSDHPVVIGIYGILPNSGMIDFEAMKRTFSYVWEHWQWNDTWGWDFPMTAMTAARLGLPEKAIDALFMDVETNTFLSNGHNYQNKSLKIYLPGNGALLTAVAMMCAGWDGSPEVNAPGFPQDGTWNVKWEGLKKIP